MAGIIFTPIKHSVTCSCSGDVRDHRALDTETYGRGFGGGRRRYNERGGPSYHFGLIASLVFGAWCWFTRIGVKVPNLKPNNGQPSIEPRQRLIDRNDRLQ